MKKILAIILSLATAVLTAVGFSACGNKVYPIEFVDSDGEIEYTATEPIVYYPRQYNSEYKSYYWTNSECLETFEYVRDLKEYYVQNLKGRNYLLFDYAYDDDDSLEWESFYNVLCSDTINDIIIQEQFAVFDMDLGFLTSGIGSSGVTGKRLSIYMWIYIKPIEDRTQQKLSLEYGQMENTNKFINFYYGEECFATCVYRAVDTITRTWFENYFKENLLWGDSL